MIDERWRCAAVPLDRCDGPVQTADISIDSPLDNDSKLWGSVRDGREWQDGERNKKKRKRKWAIYSSSLLVDNVSTLCVMFAVMKAPEIRERKKMNCKASYLYVFYFSPFLSNSARTKRCAMLTSNTWRRKREKKCARPPWYHVPITADWGWSQWIPATQQPEANPGTPDIRKCNKWGRIY